MYFEVLQRGCQTSTPHALALELPAAGAGSTQLLSEALVVSENSAFSDTTNRVSGRVRHGVHGPRFRGSRVRSDQY